MLSSVWLCCLSEIALILVLFYCAISHKILLKELNILSTSVRGEVLNFTYPALLVVFFSILEGNTKEPTWLAQHAKTLQITKENHDRLKEKIKPLVAVRSISIKVSQNQKIINQKYSKVIVLSGSREIHLPMGQGVGR